jgi:hypothetical protein
VSATDIFLSYARADRATARVIADCLAEEGLSVWWDASLHSGETFDEVIEQRLRDAKAVVVLWSPRSVASRWVRAEATQADRKNKLAPAIIEACDRPIIFELTHAADLCDWTGDVTDIRWRMFIDDLGHVIDRNSGVEPAPAAAPARTEPRMVKAPNRAPAMGRQPLRPGSEEVIVAQRPRPVDPPIEEPVARSPEPPAATAEEEMPSEVHCLELVDDELSEETFPIEASSVKFGRSAPADVVISHKSISREHCVIGLAHDELLVTDLNSTNGTYVDDVRINRTTILPVGSVVRLGQVSLRHAVHSANDLAGGDFAGDAPRRAVAGR